MLLVLFVLVRGGLGTIPQLDPHVGIDYRFWWTDIHQEHAAQDLPEIGGKVGLELVSYAGNAHEQAVEEVLVVSRKDGKGRKIKNSVGIEFICEFNEYVRSEFNKVAVTVV